MLIKIMRWTFSIVTLLSLLLLSSIYSVSELTFKAYNTPSASMAPTFLIGDYIMVSKFSYGYSKSSFPLSPFEFSGRILASQPKTGDVVIFRPPHKPNQDWIKRIIGLPGDHISIVKGIVHINDQPATLERVGIYKWADQFGKTYESILYFETLPNGLKHLILKSAPLGEREDDNTREFIVPKDHYFMMGDNRDYSEDSRHQAVGFIPNENLVGKAVFRYFSTDLPTQGGAWWMIWLWPTATRYDRLLSYIE